MTFALNVCMNVTLHRVLIAYTYRALFEKLYGQDLCESQRLQDLETMSTELQRLAQDKEWRQTKKAILEAAGCSLKCSSSKTPARRRQKKTRGARKEPGRRVTAH